MSRYRIPDETPHPYGLARRADTYDPDSETSPGAEWLTHVAEVTAEAAREDDRLADELEHGDAIGELADRAVPTYTYERWRVFTDLGAWLEDPSELGADAEDMTQAAGVALYMIAERLAAALLEEWHTDEDDEDQGDEQ